MLGRNDLVEEAPRESHHRSAGDGDRDDQTEVPGVPSLREAADQETGSVDERGEEDDAGEAEAIAEPAGEDRSDYVADCDRSQDLARDGLRLVQTVDHVQDHEAPRRRERPLPGGVRDQETPDVALPPEDEPAPPDVGQEALEDAAVPTVLAYEQDREPAGCGRDQSGGEERRRHPDLEQEVAADHLDPERDPTEDVLDALRSN